MDDDDLRVRRLFSEGEPAAHDPTFVLETFRRWQIRQLWMKLGSDAAGACAICAVLWALRPCLERVSHCALSCMGALAPAACVAIGAFYVLSPRGSPVQL